MTITDTDPAVHTTVEGALATLRDAANIDADTAKMLITLADRVYAELA